MAPLWILWLTLILAIVGMVVAFLAGRLTERRRAYAAGKVLECMAQQWAMQRIPGETDDQLRMRIVRGIRYGMDPRSRFRL